MGCPEKSRTYQQYLFADDVLLTAKSATGLQELLDIVSKWGEDRQMKWKRESREKVKFSNPRRQKIGQFILSGKNLGKNSRSDLPRSII